MAVDTSMYRIPQAAVQPQNLLQQALVFQTLLRNQGERERDLAVGGAYSGALGPEGQFDFAKARQNIAASGVPQAGAAIPGLVAAEAQATAARTAEERSQYELAVARTGQLSSATGELITKALEGARASGGPPKLSHKDLVGVIGRLRAQGVIDAKQGSALLAQSSGRTEEQLYTDVAALHQTYMNNAGKLSAAGRAAAEAGIPRGSQDHERLVTGTQGSVHRRYLALRAQGYDHNSANLIANDRVETKAHPVTGRPVLVIKGTTDEFTPQRDPAFGQGGAQGTPVQPGAPNAAGVSRPGPAASQNLYETASGATGAIPAMVDFAHGVLPQTIQIPVIGPILQGAGGLVQQALGGATPTATTQARQALRLASNDLIRTLQNNPRYSEGERKAIEREVSIAPSILESPQRLQDRMRQIDTYLAGRRDRYARIMQDPNAPVEDARNAYGIVSAIDSFRQNLNAPQEGAPAAPPRQPAATNAVPTTTYTAPAVTEDMRRRALEILRERRAAGGGGGMAE